jgi:hypothetical protein
MVGPPLRWVRNMVFLAVVALVWSVTGAAGDGSRSGVVVVDGVGLTGDADLEVRRSLRWVLEAARDHGVPVACGTVDVRFVDRIDGDPLLGGWTDGCRVLVREHIARRERYVLHELAHAIVGVDDGHGTRWRRVYLTTIRRVADDHQVALEARRLRWVYDRSHADRSASPKRHTAEADAHGAG